MWPTSSPEDQKLNTTRPTIGSGEAILIPNAFLNNSATDAARMQLTRMGDDDLELQSRLITSSYLTAQMAQEGTSCW